MELKYFFFNLASLVVIFLKDVPLKKVNFGEELNIYT